MARDCTIKQDPNAPPGFSSEFGGSPPPGMAVMSPGNPAMNNNKGFDSEYASLMAELGESGAADPGKAQWNRPIGHDIVGSGSNIPPWRRPEMWQSVVPQSNPSAQGYRPPQYPAGYGGGYENSAWAQAGYAQSYPQQDYSAAYAQYYQNQYNQMQAPAQ